MTQKSEVRALSGDGLENKVVKISERVWISEEGGEGKIIVNGEEMWVWKEEEEGLGMFAVTVLTL
jgi:hypothetical protein